jgi:hypothetical protein
MKLFGYSISLNVLILIGILYLIMVVNALSGSCNREGLTNTEIYIEDFVKSIEFTIDQAELKGNPLSTQEIQDSRDQLAGLLRAKPKDPGLLDQIANLKNRITQIEQSQSMPQAQPMTSTPNIAPSAPLESQVMPLEPQVMQPMASRPKIAPLAPLETEPSMTYIPPMIEGRYIAPSAPLQPEPIMPQAPSIMPQAPPNMPQKPTMPQGPPPKLGSIMNKLKKRF